MKDDDKATRDLYEALEVLTIVSNEYLEVDDKGRYQDNPYGIKIAERINKLLGI